MSSALVVKLARVCRTWKDAAYNVIYWITSAFSNSGMSLTVSPSFNQGWYTWKVRWLGPTIANHDGFDGVFNGKIVRPLFYSDQDRNQQEILLEIALMDRCKVSGDVIHRDPHS